MALAKPVDPRTGGQANHEERGETRGREHSDLELGRAQHQDREHRNREFGQLRAELAKRLTSPHREEVAVVPE